MCVCAVNVCVYVYVLVMCDYEGWWEYVIIEATAYVTARESILNHHFRSGFFYF